MKIYVAGKVKQRELPEIEGVSWIHPFTDKRVLKDIDSNQYVPRDIAQINSSDAMLLILETGEERNALFEAGIFWTRNQPIIAVCDHFDIKNKYNFTLRLCTSVVPSIKEAIRIVEYMAMN